MTKPCVIYAIPRSASGDGAANGEIYEFVELALSWSGSSPLLKVAFGVRPWAGVCIYRPCVAVSCRAGTDYERQQCALHYWAVDSGGSWLLTMAYANGRGYFRRQQSTVTADPVCLQPWHGLSRRLDLALAAKSGRRLSLVLLMRLDSIADFRRRLLVGRAASESSLSRATYF